MTFSVWFIALSIIISRSIQTATSSIISLFLMAEYYSIMGFPSCSDGKESACNMGYLGSVPGLGRYPGGGHGKPHQCSCLENPHEQRNLAGYSLWGHKKSDMTERLSTHNIPLYIWINVTYYHIFFIHSSVKRHLVCFHVLAIVNSAAMNTGVHVSFQSTVFSGYVPRSGVAGLYSSSILVFLGISILFSIVAVPVYIPINSVVGFTFFHTLSRIYCF